MGHKKFKRASQSELESIDPLTYNIDRNKKMLVGQKEKLYVGPNKTPPMFKPIC